MAPDKIRHLKYGVPVALFAGAVGYALLHAGAHPMAAVLAVAGIVAGAAVEGAQWADNRAAKARGQAPTRDVSALDALASAAPAWALAVAAQLGLA